MAHPIAQANLLPKDCQFTVKRSNITEIVTACLLRVLKFGCWRLGEQKKNPGKKFK